MKILILKLGILIFSLLFMAGVWREIPTGTLIVRSFIVFLVVETILVLIAVIFLKMTERIRKEIEEEVEEKAEEAVPAEESTV